MGILDEVMAERASSSSAKEQASPKPSILDEVMAEREGRAKPSSLEAGARGVAQGALVGFADETAGGGAWLSSLFPPEGLAPEFQTKPADAYRQARDEYRADDDAARAAHPVMYGGGQIVGSLAPMALVPGAGPGIAKQGAVLGAASGLGSSRNDVTKGDVVGAAIDTGIGGLAGAAAAVLPGVGGAVAPIAGAVIKDLVKKALPTMMGKAAEVIAKNPGLRAAVGQALQSRTPQAIKAALVQAAEYGPAVSLAVAQVLHATMEAAQNPAPASTK